MSSGFDSYSRRRTGLAEASVVQSDACTESGLARAITRTVERLRDKTGAGPGPVATVERRSAAIDFGGPVKNQRPAERGFLRVQVRTAAVPGDRGDSGRAVDARIYINRGDRVAGTTRGPYGWSSPEPLVAGTHRVTALYRESDWRPAQANVEIGDGETTQVALELRPRFGLMDVTTEPAGATVEVDGVRLGGTAPFRAVRVPAGRRAVVVTLRQYVPVQTNVVIEAGQARSLDYELEPDFGTIEVTTTPPGAAVLLDGAATGQTSPTTLRRVPSGRHELKIVRLGYKDVVRPVVVRRGSEQTVDVTLAAFLGSLIVRAPLMLDGGQEVECDAAVQVFFDGQLVGEKRSPAIFRDLVAAPHEVEVTCEGVVHRNLVTIEHNREQTVAFATESRQVRQKRARQAQARQEEARIAAQRKAAEDAAAAERHEALLRNLHVATGDFLGNYSLCYNVAGGFAPRADGFLFGLTGRVFLVSGKFMLLTKSVDSEDPDKPATWVYQGGLQFFDGVVLSPFVHAGGISGDEVRGAYLSFGNSLSLARIIWPDELAIAEMAPTIEYHYPLSGNYEGGWFVSFYIGFSGRAGVFQR